MCALCERDPYTGQIIFGPCLEEKTTDPVKKPSHYRSEMKRDVVLNLSAIVIGLLIGFLINTTHCSGGC